MGRRVRRIRCGNEGFTLIEAMIAMSILAFGLLALAAMQLHAMKGGASGRNTSEAADIAVLRPNHFYVLTGVTS